MKKFIALVLASSLVGCAAGDWSPEPASNEPTPPFVFHRSDYDYYWVPAPPAPVPPNRDLCCVVTDRLPGAPQPLTIGQSGGGESVDWSIDYYSGDIASGKLKMVLQAPRIEDATLGTVSMGAFRPVDFGRDSAFTLRATFQNPTPVPGKGWSFTVVARTGDAEHDTPDLSKIQLSVRIRTPVRTGVPDIDVRVQEVNGDDSTVNQINHETFFQDDPEYNEIEGGGPITLLLKVNRKTGKGSAYIKTGTKAWSKGDFSLTLFGVDSGPQLTAAGVALATDTDWGSTISVQVTDFMICASGVPC